MRNVTKIPTAAESAPHNKASNGIDDDGDNSHAPAPTGSVRANQNNEAHMKNSHQISLGPLDILHRTHFVKALFSRKTDCYLISMAALGSFSSWVQRYVAADPADRDTMVAQGVELAQDRRAALLELIDTDPREALASSVPFAVRQQLPGVITAQLEQRVSGKGDFLVLATVPREDA